VRHGSHDQLNNIKHMMTCIAPTRVRSARSTEQLCCIITRRIFHVWHAPHTAQQQQHAADEGTNGGGACLSNLSNVRRSTRSSHAFIDTNERCLLSRCCPGPREAYIHADTVILDADANI
jgi:hypothetical protein